MRTIPIAAIPNQSLTLTVDNVRYSVVLKMGRNVMTCDIAINGVEVVTGARVLAGELLIPYRYLENGNFLILTVNDELPAFESFESSQTLVFLTAAELAAIRG